MSKPRRISRSFYLRDDVILIAKELLGKVLVTSFAGHRTAGIITETEAYAGVDDRASHAFGGRRTSRNEMMYARGGMAYIYLCYGIHHLFNVVTNKKDVPHAVLIRGTHPIAGMDVMKERRGGTTLTTKGPGTLTQAFGIRTVHSGYDLTRGPITLEDQDLPVQEVDIIPGPRIGVAYAGADALLPYRFRVAPSRLQRWM